MTITVSSKQNGASLPVLASTEEALGVARDLATRFRQRAEVAEIQRTIPDESIAELIDSGLFGIATPRRWGGSDLGYEGWIRVTAEIAAACPATGWVFGVLLGHSWLVARFPMEAQEEVFGNPRSLVASLFRLGGTPRLADGGYRWSDGGGRFCSGVDHSDWVISIGAIEQADGSREAKYFLIPRADFEIVDDWFTVGMRGTGSKSIRVAPDVFIPERRSIPTGGLGSGGFTTSLIGAPLGIARGALQVFEAGLRDKLVGAAPDVIAAATPGFIRLAAAAADVDFAFLATTSGAARLDALQEGETWDGIEAARYQRNQAYAVHMCRLAVNSLFEAGGGSGIYETSTMQRYWRDMNAAASHTSSNWENAAVGYGYAVVGQKWARPSR